MSGFSRRSIIALLDEVPVLRVDQQVRVLWGDAAQLAVDLGQLVGGVRLPDDADHLVEALTLEVQLDAESGGVGLELLHLRLDRRGAGRPLDAELQPLALLDARPAQGRVRAGADAARLDAPAVAGQQLLR